MNSIQEQQVKEGWWDIKAKAISVDKYYCIRKAWRHLETHLLQATPNLDVLKKYPIKLCIAFVFASLKNHTYWSASIWVSRYNFKVELNIVHLVHSAHVHTVDSVYYQSETVQNRYKMHHLVGFLLIILGHLIGTHTQQVCLWIALTRYNMEIGNCVNTACHTECKHKMHWCSLHHKNSIWGSWWCTSFSFGEIAQNRAATQCSTCNSCSESMKRQYVWLWEIPHQKDCMHPCWL